MLRNQAKKSERENDDGRKRCLLFGGQTVLPKNEVLNNHSVLKR